MGGHVPVLLEEAVEALGARPGGRYIDGTLGRAGHARAILERGGRVLGIDRDPQAVAEVAAAARAEGGVFANLEIVQGRHGDLARIAAEHGWEDVDGVLLDLGVSSPQLDEAGRGFSFLRDGPLDMRMDASQGRTAADVVNFESAAGLEEIFRTLGEEPQARRLARAIVAEREPRPFRTTGELAGFVSRLLGRRASHHPATRVFQALRMAVNSELEELGKALEGALAVLAPGGRLAVISFESLSDRAVKRFFAAHEGRMVSLQQGGERWEGALPRVRPWRRKPVYAGAAETAANPRARSARLRCAVKCGEAGRDGQQEDI